MKKILFLCMGNICRSPAAHCVFQHLVNQAGLGDQFEIDSAGTIGFHAGSPPDGRMQQALRARNIPIIGRARQLTADDLETYDWILAMDQENLARAHSLDSDGRHRDKIKLFADYCRKEKVDAIPDPYYGGDQGFEHVLDLVEDGCANLLSELRTDT